MLGFLCSGLWGWVFCLVLAFCLFVWVGLVLVLFVGWFFFPIPRKEQGYPVRKPLEETVFGNFAQQFLSTNYMLSYLSKYCIFLFLEMM